MTTSTRLRAAVLLPAIAAVATLLLTGCLQVSAPDTEDTAEPTPSSDTEDTDTEDTDAEGETVDVFSITVGDCILDPSGTDTVTETTVIDCAEDHTYEVYSGSTVADGDFPGDDAINAQAETDCTGAFEPFVGLAYDESALLINFYVPTEGSWEAGDREILCLIGDPSGSNAGTLEGAGY